MDPASQAVGLTQNPGTITHGDHSGAYSRLHGKAPNASLKGWQKASNHTHTFDLLTLAGLLLCTTDSVVSRTAVKAHLPITREGLVNQLKESSSPWVWT